MPHKATVFRWLADDADFRDLYARAKEASTEALAEELLDIADDGSNDWMERPGADGESLGWQLNGEHVQRSRLRVDTRKWLLAKLQPRKYGERQTVEHEGSVNHFVMQVPHSAGSIDEWLKQSSSGVLDPARSTSS